MNGNGLLTALAGKSGFSPFFRAKGRPALLFRLRPYLPTALIAIVLTYVCVQYLTGDKGFFSQEARDHDMKVKELQLQQLTAQRIDLEARAKYLRTDNLSKDLLQERARVLLGLSEPDAYVVRDAGDPKAAS